MKKFIAGMLFMHYLILISRSDFVQAVTLGVLKNYKRLEEETRPSASVIEPEKLGEIELETKADAEGVLAKLQQHIKEYDVVTVEDLYSVLGVSATYVDSKYGWTDLDETTLKRTRGGYALLLPKPIKL